MTITAWHPERNKGQAENFLDELTGSGQTRRAQGSDRDVLPSPFMSLV